MTGFDASVHHAAWRGVPDGIWLSAAALFLSAVVTAPILPVFDPDEGYYPATAAESVDAGDWWDLRFNGEPRWDKPILSYALIETSFAMLGRSVVAARLPSALEGLGLVLFVGFIVRGLVGRSAAVACAAVLSTTVGIQVFSRVAHPEIGVVFAITAAELMFVAYLHGDRAQQRRLAALIGFAVGCGILTKGPIALLLPVLTIAAATPFVRTFWRSWTAAALDAALAGGVALLIAVPWYAAMTLRHGVDFVNEALWRHNVGRYTSGDFGHRGGLLFFVVPTLVSILPWTMFIVDALRTVDPRDRTPVGTLRLVAACSAGTAFAFYSLSASKLPHYALVFVPPLAVLVGLSVNERLMEGHHRIRALRATAVVHVVLGIVIATVPWMVGYAFTARELLGGSPLQGTELQVLLAQAMIPPAVILGIYGAVNLWSNVQRAVGLTICLGAVLPAVLLVSATPLLRTTYPWERFGRQIHGTASPVWMVGPRAPSLTFFASHPVSRITEGELSDLLRSGAEGWIIVETNWLREANVTRQFSDVVIDVQDTSGTMTLARVHTRHDPL